MRRKTIRPGSGYCGKRRWGGGLGLLARLATAWMFAATCWADRPSDDLLAQALRAVLTTNASDGASQPSAAWKTVASADYSQLPQILRAADEANPLSGNWLSMALDQIVQQSDAKGEPLPAEMLKAVALDTTRALLSRKMALDLLARADAASVESLQTQFINDPQSELRRPAIERAIEETKKLSDQSPEERVSAWQSLMSAARDEDQVVQIAKELKSLNREVDLAGQFGYLLDWYVVGPFDNTDGEGFDRAYPPEQLTLADYEELAAGAAVAPMEGKSGPVSWKKAQAVRANGDLNLNEAIDKQRSVVGYGATVFVADKEHPAELRLRIQNSFKIWLNGQLLMEQPVGHTGNSFDQYKVQAQLRGGKNLILVKSCQVDLKGPGDFYDNWHFCVRVSDATGAAILSADWTDPVVRPATGDGESSAPADAAEQDEAADTKGVKS